MTQNTNFSLRSSKQALIRGFLGRCPACGQGRIFGKYLKVNDHCPDCGEALHHHEADDAPAYFTILIIGHLMVPLALVAERQWSPSTGLLLSVLIPAIIVASLLLLPRIKGALVSFQWSRGLHGFGETAAQAA